MDDKRHFLAAAIASGLDFGAMKPGDVLKHVTMDSLASALPSEQLAHLIEAALKAKAMTPAMVIDTVGVEIVATHVPMHLLWAVVAESANTLLGVEASDDDDDDDDIGDIMEIEESEDLPKELAAEPAKPLTEPSKEPSKETAKTTKPSQVQPPVPPPRRNRVTSSRKPNRPAPGSRLRTKRPSRGVPDPGPSVLDATPRKPIGVEPPPVLSEEDVEELAAALGAPEARPALSRQSSLDPSENLGNDEVTVIGTES